MTSPYPSIRLEGGLFAPDLLDQVRAGELPGQKAADFSGFSHWGGGTGGRVVRERQPSARYLTDHVARSLSDARQLWSIFQRRLDRTPANGPATSVTRDAWVIPFLGLLDYDLQYNRRAYDLDGLTFWISHRAGQGASAPPVHIVGVRQELGRIPVSGRPRMSPHALLQEYLNRTEALWGVVTNGTTLRLLRDCTNISRQAYIEFNLLEILEEQRFEDFEALYRLLHRSRLPTSTEDASDCRLEGYYQHSLEQGGRIRDKLRDGVEDSIQALANGFLSHSANEDLRRRVAPSCEDPDRLIAAEELYRQLLTLIYRLLFLLVAEDRGLLGTNALYRNHYGVVRLIRRLDQPQYTGEGHDDLWQSLRVLWRVLRAEAPSQEANEERMAGLLGLPVLNGDLFERQSLDEFTISNRDFLEGFEPLARYREDASAPPRRVNYAALDVEELGSVYESLLEFRPLVTETDGSPRFKLGLGSERKSTGSYYTPPELVAELLRSALDPVLQERLEACDRDEKGKRRSCRSGCAIRPAARGTSSLRRPGGWARSWQGSAPGKRSRPRNGFGKRSGTWSPIRSTASTRILWRWTSAASPSGSKATRPTSPSPSWTTESGAGTPSWGFSAWADFAKEFRTGRSVRCRMTTRRLRQG